MYASPRQPINPQSILLYHLKVLEEAVSDCMDYDVRSAAVYEALDYIETQRPHLKWPCSQFREALENWSPLHLHEAFNSIRDKWS